MPATEHFFDTYVAPEMSKLTACAPASVAADFPQRGRWLTQYSLRLAFQNHVVADHVASALAMLRRAEAAIAEWEQACVVAPQAPKNPSAYFQALRHFEACLSSVWQGFDFGRKSFTPKMDLFADPVDGPVFKRINELYNLERHFERKQLAPGDLLPMWITNDGLKSRQHELTFAELRDAVSVLGRIGQALGGDK